MYVIEIIVACYSLFSSFVSIRLISSDVKFDLINFIHSNALLDCFAWSDSLKPRGNVFVSNVDVGFVDVFGFCNRVRWEGR